MIKISDNGIISMVRGDSAEFPLFINQGNRMYPIRYSMLRDQGSAVEFSLMTFDKGFEDAFFKKRYTSASPHTSQRDLIITFEPEDTFNIPPGKYFYSIRLITYKDGHYCIKPIVSKNMFFLTN